MSSLRHAIENPRPVKEVIVDVPSGKFRILGKPNVNMMSGSITLPQNEVKMLSLLWQRVLEMDEPFDESMVKHVRLVWFVLQPESWIVDTPKVPATKDTPEIPEVGHWVRDEKDNDPIDIAAYANAHTADFLKMMGAAYISVGLASEDNVPTDKTGFDEIAAGNSQTPTPSS